MYLYPKFDKVTHIVKVSLGNSKEYPANSTFKTKNDYKLKEDVYEILVDPEGNQYFGSLLESGCGVSLIRENVGHDFDWSLVKVVDPVFVSAEFYNKEFYILTQNLKNISTKKQYEAFPTKGNEINKKAPVIDPLLKEIFTPYIDRREGMVSVRVQVDYDRILDMVLFEQVLEEVYVKGMQLILSSMGKRSDNKEIEYLRKNYYTLAYINKDLDATIKRECEPLTFTVSMPLSFFDRAKKADIEISKDILYTVTFNNNNFVEKIENIIKILLSRNSEIENLTYPSKYIKNFLLDGEIQALRQFAFSTNEILSLAGLPINNQITADSSKIEYTFGFDESLELLSITARKFNQNLGYEEIVFNDSIIVQSYFNGGFYNKRIFNYLINLDQMTKDIVNREIYSFLLNYVKFPEISLEEDQISINGEDVPPEVANKFISRFTEGQEACYTVKDLINFGTQVAGDVAETGYGIAYALGAKPPEEKDDSFAAGLYKFFLPQNPNTFPNLMSTIDSMKSSWSGLSTLVAESKAPNANITNIALDSRREGSTKSAGDPAVVSFLEKMASDFNFSSYQDGIQSVNAILRRLNVTKLLFQYIYCQLRGSAVSSETAKEAAEVYSQLPNEVIAVLRAFNNPLKGYRWLRYAVNSTNLDIKLFCNDEITYFLKQVTFFAKEGVKLAHKIFKFSSDIEKTISSYKSARGTKDIWAEVGKAVGKTLYDTLSETVYAYVTDLLSFECDDPSLNNAADDFADPFNTHAPSDRFGGQENNNPETLKENRTKALMEAAPDVFETLQVGGDIEYAVDLVELLMRDLRCILSPIEIVELLRGEPRLEIIILLKNLIKNKYSKEPNNLSYLLQGNKLELLFAGIGKRVDQNLLDRIVDSTLEAENSLGQTFEDVCGDIPAKARSDLFNNKVPDLGFLEDNARKRIQKAKQLLENLRNPEQIINVSALCAETEDQNIKDLKSSIIEKYVNPINSIFEPVLENFNNNSDSLLQAFQEEKVFLRRDANGNIFNKIEYYTYNSTLSQNLQDSQNFEIDKEIIKYMPKERAPLTNKELADTFLKTESKTQLTICTGSFTENAIFSTFLSQGRILFESRRADRSWGRSEESYAQRWYKDSKTEFYDQLKNENEVFLQYFKEKKTLFFISAVGGQIFFRHIAYDSGNDDFRVLKKIEYEEINPEDSNEIQIKKRTNRLLLKTTLENYTGVSIAKDGADGYGTNKFLDPKTKEPVQAQVIYQEYYPGVVKFFPKPNPAVEAFGDIVGYIAGGAVGLAGIVGGAILSPHLLVGVGIAGASAGLAYLTSAGIDAVINDESKKDAVHVLGADFLDLKELEPASYKIEDDGKKITSTETGYFDEKYVYPIPVKYPDPINTLNVIQEAIVTYSQTDVQSLDSYEIAIGIFEKFKVGGLFNISSSYGSQEIYKKVMVATAGPENKELLYKNFYTTTSSLDTTNESLYSFVPYFNRELYSRMSNYMEDTYGLFVKTSGISSEIEEEKKKLFPQIIFGESGEAWFQTAGKLRPKDLSKFSEYLSDKTLTIMRDPNYFDLYKENYTSLSKLNLSNDPLYSSCGVVPHYLNLRYFLNKALEDAKNQLCDSNVFSVPYEMIDLILVNLTIRAQVTSLLVKATPLLSMFNQGEVRTLYKEQLLVDILREQIKHEMELSTPGVEISTDNHYYTGFLNKKIKSVFLRMSEGVTAFKINNKFITNTSQEENIEIDYFIRKEIKHFIDYALQKTLFRTKDYVYTRSDQDYLKKLLSKILFPNFDVEKLTNTQINTLIDHANTHLRKKSLYDLYLNDPVSIINYIKANIIIKKNTENPFLEITGNPFLETIDKISFSSDDIRFLDGTLYTSDIFEIDVKDTYSKNKKFRIKSPYFDIELNMLNEKSEWFGAWNQKCTLDIVYPPHDPEPKENFFDGKVITVDFPETNFPFDYEFKTEKNIIFADIEIKLKFGKIEFLVKNIKDHTSIDAQKYPKIKQIIEKISFIKENKNLLDAGGEENIKNIREAVKIEILSAFSYFLMADTVDNKKRSIFGSTLQELAKIFFSTTNQSENQQTGYPEENREDIIKFISQLAFSSNPSVLAQTSPTYLVYWQKFVESIWKATKQTLGAVASATDVNILVTKIMTQLFVIGQSAVFSFMDEKQKKDSFAAAAMAEYHTTAYWGLSRIRDGKFYLPEIITSPMITLCTLGGVPLPGPVGWAYLGMDTVDEALYGIKNYEEYTNLRKQIAEQTKKDPCEAPKTDAEYPKCTPEFQENLLKEINDLEQG